MTLHGKYFGPLNGMAQGKAPYNAARSSCATPAISRR